MDKYPVGVWRIGTSVLVSAGTAIIVTLLVLAIKEEGSIATTAAAQHEVSTEQEPLQSQEKQSHEQAEAEWQRLASEAAEAAMQRQIGGGDKPAGFTFINNVRRNVEQKWAIPDSADDSMSVTVKVRLGPAGEVLSTSIVTSSGNGAFDLSGIQAVENAAPFGELRCRYGIRRLEIIKYISHGVSRYFDDNVNAVCAVPSNTGSFPYLLGASKRTF